ncbi:hypothetical protein BGZ83_010443 [Gryganskiella cystojenkinii]|nr:hypothetical protein BGZ83_010443 [Gryganskiella cystojenkinii]
MLTEDAPLTKEEHFHKIYTATLITPFKEQYEEKWQDEPFWAAVDAFKAQVKEIGFDDPLERLKSYMGRETFEKIRDNLKAGPPACLRKDWISPFTGETIDVLSVVERIHHVRGAKFEGKERIVLVDFWATWCGPCVDLALHLSDISEKYAGQVAVIGIGNEAMLGKRYPGMLELEGITKFIESKKENFRYSSYVDNADEHARDALYEKTGSVALPTVVLVVDNVVRFAGTGTKFEEHFEKVVNEMYPKEA